MLAEERPRLNLTSAPFPSRKALPPFEALRAFDAIARFGGVRRAAEYLSRDHAVVSRHLRTIEDWTGIKLIERTPTGTVLTEDGIRYHKQIASAIDAIASATVKLMKRDENRRLHVRCMPEFALHWLSARLGQFEQDNRGVDIEVRPTDRSPDSLAHLADIEIRFVATYRGAFELSSMFRSVEIAHAPVIAVASRDYLSHVTPIRRPRDLLNHQLLREENYDSWRAWFAKHGVADDVELTGPRLWHGPLALDAARHGRGVVLTNQLTAAADLGEVRLIEVGKGFESFRPPAMGIWHFIARADRWDTGPISCFRAWLMSRIAKEHPHLRPASSA